MILINKKEDLLVKYKAKVNIIFNIDINLIVPFDEIKKEKHK